MSPFPTMGHPSWSREEIQGCLSLFLQPWLPGCLCAQMVGNGWLQATVTQIPVATRTIISVCYQLRIAHWIFLCYLILSIPGPDPIKIPSSIYITETHPNLHKSLFAGLTSPACCRRLHSLQVGSVYFAFPTFLWHFNWSCLSLIPIPKYCLPVQWSFNENGCVLPRVSWISLGSEDKELWIGLIAYFSFSLGAS